METLVISIFWCFVAELLGGCWDQNEDSTELEAELAASNSARKAAVENPDDPSCL